MQKKTEYKTFSIKFDDVSEQMQGDQPKGMIRGYASTFGNIDLGDDVIDKGAFRKTIKENDGKFPILADHNPSKLLGYNINAKEDKTGLLVEGLLNLDVQLAKERFSLIRMAADIGKPMGLSIGFQTIKAVSDPDRPRVRRIKEARLFEYSVVAFPMNESAMVTGAKGFDAFDAQLNLLVDEALNDGHNHKKVFDALEKAASRFADPDNTYVQSFEKKLDELIKRKRKGI